MTANAYKVDDESWALSINVPRLNENCDQSPMALHFVVDTSSSMGTLSQEVVSTFADMIDSVANKPCSLTTFSTKSKLLSENITTTKQMKNISVVSGGMTNIPAGVKSGLDVVCRAHEKEKNTKHNNDSSGASMLLTHHVLVLLTDGQHNTGPTPKQKFSSFKSLVVGKYPDIKLSVVVVGFSRNSSTSMGMLLKTSVETVPFDHEIVQTVYFATTRDDLRRTMKTLADGLLTSSMGRSHKLIHDTECFVRDVDQESKQEITIHRPPQTNKINVLCRGTEPPKIILVDGAEVHVSIIEDNNMIDLEVIESIAKTLINRAKICSVASDDPAAVRRSVASLDGLVSILEKESAKTATLTLSKQSPYDRLKQFQNIKRACHGMRELRNQLLDLANFTAADSEAQAHFLTGNSSKFAAKARRLAANRNSGGTATIINPSAERQAILEQLGSDKYKARILMYLKYDAYANFERLVNNQKFTTKDDDKTQFIVKVRQHDSTLVPLIQDLLSIDFAAGLSLENVGDVVANIDCQLTPRATKFVESGRLAEMLNDMFHGSRQSYLSLLSPAQHILDWTEFDASSGDVTTLWEALMFAGVVGYPVAMEHPDAAQMNPFLATVKWLHQSPIDTASLCCARKAEVNIYGPEGGEPLEDALVLVDPSCPVSSTAIANGRLIGEKYTSAVIARDLHMYTGAKMKAALHANSLFYLISGEASRQSESSRVCADMQRLIDHIGHAYECPKCGYGPVTHSGCSDLLAHHGEQGVGNSRVSNACPSCNFLGSSLDAWNDWSGNFSSGFIQNAVGPKSFQPGSKYQIEKSAIDLVLRILYSFRKMFGSSIMEMYEEFANRLYEWDFRLSTKDDIDSLNQLLIAVMVSNETDGNKVQQAFAKPCVLEFITEASARASRARFRTMASGDEVAARLAAQEHVTALLGVTESSSPMTQSLLEPEPDIKKVKKSARTSFNIDLTMAETDIEFVDKKVVEAWPCAIAFVKAFRKVLDKRPGGWKQLEIDMETGTEFYNDIVTDIQKEFHAAPKTFEELAEITSSYPEYYNNLVRDTKVAIAARGALQGMKILDTNLDEECGTGNNAYSILGLLARDMRMVIYMERVKIKMEQFHDAGEELICEQAKSADTLAFAGMIHSSCQHVHGLRKEEFWGFWNAALGNGAKESAFLESANDTFRMKYTCNGKKSRTKNKYHDKNNKNKKGRR